MQPTGKAHSKGPSISADKNSRSPSPQITNDRATRVAEMSQKGFDSVELMQGGKLPSDPSLFRTELNRGSAPAESEW